MEELLTSAGLISLLTLTVLEVILGIDNVIFVSIIMGRMPTASRKRARTLWMVFGIITRTALLFALGWLLTQKGKPLFTIPVVNKGIDIASLVMIIGGLFLLFKTVTEIHHKLEGEEETKGGGAATKTGSFGRGMFQIVLVDMVFSFDSVITASGVANHLSVMITAVVIAMMVMFFFSERISNFVHKHPTIKMLALSFLVMIGLILIIEGWAPEKAHDLHLKNYVYFAMAFSFIVEMLNMRLRKTGKPVVLNEPDAADIPGDNAPLPGQGTNRP